MNNEHHGKQPSSVAQLVACLTADPWVPSSKPQFGHITLEVIDHEIIFMASLSLPLIQEGQLSVTDKSMWGGYQLLTKVCGVVISY